MSKFNYHLVLIKFFYKKLYEFFGNHNEFNVVSIQINRKGEYSFKCYIKMKENTERIFDFKKKFDVLFEERDEKFKGMQIKCNLRMKDISDVEKLWSICEKTNNEIEKTKKKEK